MPKPTLTQIDSPPCSRWRFFSLHWPFVLSRVVASNSARRYLTARLEQAFGRPVDVSKFSIRWIPTPGIVAERVTIGEDPRFGQEYFLRADSIVASPRWRSLFMANWNSARWNFLIRV